MVATKISTCMEDDVVISGMSGRFPNCDTVAEFHEKLLSGVDLVKEDDSRWPNGYLGTYSRMGFINDLRNFDAPFFGAHPKLAERTDPIVRILLEITFEAILDAGICPTSLRGSETAVIAVVSSNEAADWWSADPDRVNGYEFLGCTRTMYSNRISFAFDLKGPSYTMDCQSASGLFGIQQGYYMLKTGLVDAVIVAGVNCVLNPHFNIMFQKLNMLSKEGKCKTFDQDANGYARSEAGVAIIMQRAKDSKRVYATVAGCETNCDGFQKNGCNTVSMSSQIQLYRQTYDKFHLNPLDVTLIEAHGYATRDGDRAELNGITEVFCKGREFPLLIGSVKSNMGHSEPVGGLVSLVKILLTMENNIVPPNLHFKTPNTEVPALKDRRLSVVDKLTIWNDEYAAINSFGIGGINSHLVLKRNEKEKKNNQKTNIPRLIVVSGRTESTVKSLLEQVYNLYGDNEFCSLLYSIFSQHINHYNYRGFAVFNEEPITEISMYTPQDESRPICFVFSGMGSQWPGMGKNLLQMELFKKTIDTCAEVLKNVDFNLYEILLSDDKKVFNNVLNSFVGITCIQIALVNILYALNVKPDFIIGHSIGELACAYADGTLTLEQTTLATYWRGKSLLMSDITKGAMAAIGLSHEELSKRLPSDITIACYNSVDNVTISGPFDSINKFTKILQHEGNFAREVNSSGFAFHSQYIAKAGPLFKTALEKIITESKVRSKRWISTSIPKSQWNTPSAQYSSVTYHLNNLLAPVFFYEGLNQIPHNAVVIEIAPHALLQSILKGSLPTDCTHIGLLKRNEATVVELLSNIGRLYNAGLQLCLEKLYPPVSFPVSRKTPMIQSLVEWDHSQKWFLVTFLTKPVCVRGEVEIDVDVTNKRYKFLSSCVIDDIPTFPISGYLCLIWEAAAKFQLKHITQIPITIENFQLLRKCTLSNERPLKFVVNILENNGDCEIKENGVLVARAVIRITKNVEQEFSYTNKAVSEHDNNLPLKPSDLYLDLYMKGYLYKNEFRGLKYTDNKGENGKIKWFDNWITYLEAMLQLHILRLSKQQQFYSINYIQKLIIDPQKHIQMINETDIESGISVNVFSHGNLIKSGGIELRDIKSTLVSIRTRQPDLTLEYYTFVPHVSEKIFNSSQALTVCVQIMCENSDTNNVLQIAEIVTDLSSHYLYSSVLKIIEKEPYVKYNLTLHSKNKMSDTVSSINEIYLNNDVEFSSLPSSEKYDFIVTSDIFSKPTIMKHMLNFLAKAGFLLTIEKLQNVVTEDDINNLKCKLIAKFNSADGVYILLRKEPKWKTPMVVVIKNNTFDWIDGIKMAIRKHKIDKRNTLLIFHGNEPTGIVGLLKSIRREPFGNGLRCIYTDDTIQPYKIVDLTYINYLRKGLIFNIHKNGEWGSYRHFPVENKNLIECEHAFIGPREIGNLSSLSYIEGRIPYINLSHFPNHELCYVYYASIYAHDIRSTFGHLPYDDYTNVIKQGSVLGHEYSGRNSKGERIFGMVGGGSLATTVLADRTVMWDVPNYWSLEQASTIPRIYSVAYYALLIRGKLKKGETVYINSGISGLSVACLKVAIGIGARAFIGYNNQIEKKYLNESFPELNNLNFINLEDSFEYQLLHYTKGNGVDLIFDVLNSHKRNLFIDALAVNGRLIEFEKSTMFNESLGCAAVKKSITFHKISHYTLWVSDAGKKYRELIHELVAEGIRTGIVKPIETNIFLDNEVEKAFRVAQSGEFIGKVVIKFRDEESQKCVKPKTKIVKAYPSAFLKPENSYIITAGLTEYGIQLVDWMITRGAKKIFLLSQYKPVTGYQYLALRRWKNCQVDICLLNSDATTSSGAENVIERANNLGPVGGIFHIAYVACENKFEKCFLSNFELLWKMKVEMAIHLDSASRKLCPDLKYFVGFSDMASLHGVANKSMFGYSCSALEMVFEKRSAEDYPAIVIQQGILDKFDVDYVQNNQKLIPIKFSSIIKKLPELLNQPYVIVSAYSVAEANDNCRTVLKGNNLINDIADILEIKSSQKVHSLTFEDIGMEPVVFDEIKKVLRDYNVKIRDDEIRELSFNKILSMFN